MPSIRSTASDNDSPAMDFTGYRQISTTRITANRTRAVSGLFPPVPRDAAFRCGDEVEEVRDFLHAAVFSPGAREQLHSRPRRAEQEPIGVSQGLDGFRRNAAALEADF